MPDDFEFDTTDTLTDDQRAELEPKDEPAAPAPRATSAQADGAGDDEDDDAEPVVEKKPEPKPERTKEGRLKSIQAEIDREYARKKAAEREAAAEEARLADLRRQRTALESPAPSSKSAADDKEPTVGDTNADGSPKWENYEQFVKALARWEARQERRELEQSLQTERERGRQEAEQRARQAAHQKRLEAAIAADATFMDRLKLDIPLPRPAIDAIIDSEVGPQLLEYLSDDAHADFAQRLATLHPLDVVREMARLEVRLEAAHRGPASTSPIASAAKPPIKPLGSAPLVPDDEGSDDEPLEAHIKRENARDARRRRA